MIDENHEDPNNIVILCQECTRAKYPNRGLFKKHDLLGTTYIKKCFNREHMWVKISVIEDDGVVGIVDNVPMFEDSPKLGEEVFIGDMRKTFL